MSDQAEQERLRAIVSKVDYDMYHLDRARRAEAERDAAQRDLAHQEDLTDRQRARTAELERGLAEAEAERDALRETLTKQEKYEAGAWLTVQELRNERDVLRAAHHDAAAQWQEEARLRREAQGEAERLREWNARLLSQATVAEEEARQAQAEVERLRMTKCHEEKPC